MDSRTANKSRTVALYKATVRLSHTPDEQLDTLKHITVTVQSGIANLQTYGDPEEIRELADALREFANDVDGADDTAAAERREDLVRG